MTSNTKRNTNDETPKVLLEGLALEVSILDGLLKRHRCSHGRTIYFRRMSMTLNRLLQREKSIHGKPKNMIAVTAMVYRLNALKENISDRKKDQNLKGRKRRHNEDDEKWDLQSLKKASGTATALSPTKKIVDELKLLISFWTRNMPEILSRIQHASKALFIEVSRGFFLPFCTVALSALARIRSLVMEIGLRGLTGIQSLSDEVFQVFPENDAQTLRPILVNIDYEHFMNLFLENDDDEIERKRKILVKNTSGTQDAMCDREAILRSLGLTESKRSNSKAAGKLNHDDSDIPSNSNQVIDNESNNMETSSADDYFALASSATDLGKAVDDENSVEMDDGMSVEKAKQPFVSQDSLDRNMALVNKFKKQKTDSRKKEKTKKTRNDSKIESQTADESERKSKKRKHKKKDVEKKKKKKKKDKVDFFDQIFD